MSIPITPGSGAIVSGDTIGGEDFQRIKLTDGLAGSAVMARVNARGSLHVVAGNSAEATYVVNAVGLASTADVAIIAIEAPAAGVIRLARLVLWQPGIIGTAAVRNFRLRRTTAAGTGGTTVTPTPYDTGSAAYGGVARTGSTITAGVDLDNIAVFTPTALAAFVPLVIDWADAGVDQQPTIPAGTANGLALWVAGAAGAASLSATVVFTVGT